MLRLRNKQTGEEHQIYFADAHHHLGEDEDGMEVKPVGSNNSYNFCRKLINGDSNTIGLERELEENEDEYNWEPSRKGLVKVHPLIQRLKEKIPEEKVLSYSIDQIVVFPMHDVFRDRGNILYSSSNNFVGKWTNVEPHSQKLIGFGRLDPNEPLDENKGELRRMVKENNLNGLKLHPQSDEFDIGEQVVKEIMKECARLNIPIIFHTSYGNEVDKLREHANEIFIDFFEEGKKELISRLKIIVGHCTYQSDKVFNALSHPSIYGELSTLNTPVKYFNQLSEKVGIQKFEKRILPDIVGRHNDLTKREVKDIFGDGLDFFEWHHKVMVGTDHPYMPVSRLVELIKGLLSKDSGLGFSAIQNIASANLFRVINPRIPNNLDTNFAPSKISDLKDYKVKRINPVVEPPLGEEIHVDRNFVTIEKDDKMGNILHEKIRVENFDKDEDYIQTDNIYSFDELREKFPFLWDKRNYRELPENPEERIKLSRF